MSIGRAVARGVKVEVTWLRGIAVVVALCAFGCSREEPGGIVFGKVSYQGKSLSKGTVTFQPASGGGQLCYGNIQGDGTFKLKNQTQGEMVPVGEYVATVLVDNATVAVMQEDPMLLAKAAPEIPVVFSSVTTSPLRYDVQLGPNEFTINLDEHSKK